MFSTEIGSKSNVSEFNYTNKQFRFVLRIFVAFSYDAIKLVDP